MRDHSFDPRMKHGQQLWLLNDLPFEDTSKPSISINSVLVILCCVSACRASIGKLDKRTSRPSLSSSTYLMFNDDEATEAAIAKYAGAVSGKRRRARSTVGGRGLLQRRRSERARDNETEKGTLEANLVRDLAVNVLQRFYGGHVRPNMKKRKTEEGEPLPLLPSRNYYKRSASLKSGDGSVLVLRFSAGERAAWTQRVVQRPAREATEGRPRFDACEATVWQWGRGAEERKLRLAPTGKGIMGRDLPDVSVILIALSKAFSPFGDDATYYLNESKHLQRWCDVNGKSLVNLPSRKGSRQGWTLAVGTAVMLNAEAYSDYMHQVRADEKELNKLISSSWNAVADKYFIAAASARSFVDVAFAKPLNFFVHSDFTARPHLARIMSRAEEWITRLGNLDDVGKAKPPPIDLLASLILSEFESEDYHEDWKDEYDDWYGKVGEGLEEAYTMATGTDRWHRVSSHLLAACEPMLATHRRNLDEDTSTNEDLAHAPKVSDDVEAGFGCFDYALNKTGASVESAAGVGQSMKMGAMKNDGQLREDARKKALVMKRKWEERRKRKRERKGEDEDEDDEEFNLEASEEAALKGDEGDVVAERHSPGGAMARHQGSAAACAGAWEGEAGAAEAPGGQGAGEEEGWRDQVHEQAIRSVGELDQVQQYGGRLVPGRAWRPEDGAR